MMMMIIIIIMLVMTVLINDILKILRNFMNVKLELNSGPPLLPLVLWVATISSGFVPFILSISYQFCSMLSACFGRIYEK